MSADRPINADVEPAPDAEPPAPAPVEEPKTEEVEAVASPEPKPESPRTSKPEPKTPPKPESPRTPESEQTPEPEQTPPPPPRTVPRGRGRHIPGAIKLVAALVALAIGFIVLAIVAGSGGSGKKLETATTTVTGAAPSPVPPPAASGAESEGEAKAEAPSQSAEELGYPGFATDNTTRVGGSDPATIAAASALAVFPATNAAQRPAAVTLSPEDPRFAIPAAVMMAPPVRAPLLYFSGHELPGPSAAALEALAPTGSKDSGGYSAFAIAAGGSIDVPVSGKVAYSGTISADATLEGAADAIAAMHEEVVGESPDAYILAPLQEPEIAAPAAAWAARSGDPVLEAEGDELGNTTAALLKKHSKIPVFVLGPSSSISGAVLKEVAKLGNPVQRVSGKDPIANALAFARFGSGKFGWDVNDPGHGFVLARSQDPLAAAGASALSAAGTWGPLLLTDSAATLPDAVHEYFLDVKPGYTTDPTRAFYNHVWVIGDQEAIDVKQQAEVNELAELAKIGGEGE